MDDQDDRRLLVIDDDPVYRELLSMSLSSEGYRVLLAENGHCAKDVLARERVDLIIVDILMPVMDGLHFIHWLRQEASLDIPALVLTSLDNRKLSIEALVAGATDVLIKPVSLPTLVKKLSVLSP